MAAHVLALHGSPASLRVLRYLKEEAKQREVRLAAEQAISAIETRERTRKEMSERSIAVLPWKTTPTRTSEKAS
jgi:hypoxanthine phosphoribosyltransferase